MARQQAPAAYPAFSLLDHLQVLFLSICPSVVCCGPRASSPPASPQTSAELDALLEPVDDNDRDDAVSLHSQYGKGRGRRKHQRKGKEITIGGFSLFGRRQRQEQDSESVDGEASSAFAVRDDGDGEDAQDVDSSTLNHLPELAQKWEPTVTLEDLQREEARLEEMERAAERAGGLDIYSHPTQHVASSDGGCEEDFGDFEAAPLGEEGENILSIAAQLPEGVAGWGNPVNEPLELPHELSFSKTSSIESRGQPSESSLTHLSVEQRSSSASASSPKTGSSHLSITASSEAGSAGSSSSVGGNPLPRPQRR